MAINSCEGAEAFTEPHSMPRTVLSAAGKAEDTVSALKKFSAQSLFEGEEIGPEMRDAARFRAESCTHKE